MQNSLEIEIPIAISCHSVLFFTVFNVDFKEVLTVNAFHGVFVGVLLRQIV